MPTGRQFVAYKVSKLVRSRAARHDARESATVSAFPLAVTSAIPDMLRHWRRSGRIWLMHSLSLAFLLFIPWRVSCGGAAPGIGADPLEPPGPRCGCRPTSAISFYRIRGERWSGRRGAGSPSKSSSLVDCASLRDQSTWTGLPSCRPSQSAPKLFAIASSRALSAVRSACATAFCRLARWSGIGGFVME